MRWDVKGEIQQGLLLCDELQPLSPECLYQYPVPLGS